MNDAEAERLQAAVAEEQRLCALKCKSLAEQLAESRAEVKRLGRQLAEARDYIERLWDEVERLTKERDHAREALQDEVRLRAELQKRAEAAERQLAEARDELDKARIQIQLISMGRDWWILHAAAVMPPEQFEKLQGTSPDEIARAMMGRGK